MPWLGTYLLSRRPLQQSKVCYCTSADKLPRSSAIRAGSTLALTPSHQCRQVLPDCGERTFPLIPRSEFAQPAQGPSRAALNAMKRPPQRRSQRLETVAFSLIHRLTNVRNLFGTGQSSHSSAQIPVSILILAQPLFRNRLGFANTKRHAKNVRGAHYMRKLAFIQNQLTFLMAALVMTVLFSFQVTAQKNAEPGSRHRSQTFLPDNSTILPG